MLTRFSETFARLRSLVGKAIAGNAQAALDALAQSYTVTRAINLYHGIMAPQLKVKAGDPDDNVLVNYAQIIVNKSVAFLFGKPLKISVGGDNDPRGEAYLEKVWSQGQRDEEFQELAQDAALVGHAYLKIVIDGQSTPRVVTLDPATMAVEVDPHEQSRVVSFVCEYPLGERAIFRETTTRSGDGRTWQIDQSVSHDGGKVFTPAGDSVTWNFSFPPIFHCKNLPNPRSVYGRPDLDEQIMRLVEYISRLDSMCGKIVRMHASPKPWARNLKRQDLEWGTDGMLFLNPAGAIGGGQKSVEAEIGLLEMHNDISTALALRAVLREGLAEVSGVPEIASGKVGALGQLAGVALRILYGPLIEKTELKRLRFGRMIRECVEALLVIGRIDKPGAVVLHWSDPLPGDELEKARVAEAKQRVGFSPDTLIRELGGDPKKELAQGRATAARVGSELLDGFNRGDVAEGDERLAA